jgi:hypothetical protein
MKLTKKEIKELIHLHDYEVMKHAEEVRIFEINAMEDAGLIALQKKNAHLGRIVKLQKRLKRLKKLKKDEKNFKMP